MGKILHRIRLLMPRILWMAVFSFWVKFSGYQLYPADFCKRNGNDHIGLSDRSTDEGSRSFDKRRKPVSWRSSTKSRLYRCLEQGKGIYTHCGQNILAIK